MKTKNMKKIVFFFVCVLGAVSMHAQSHSFRDTSIVRYKQFDFDEYVLQDIDRHTKVYDIYPIYPNRAVMHNIDIVQYNYTANPAGMEIVGLSATVRLGYGVVQTDVPNAYLMLYEATPDTFELKSQIQWFEHDTAGRPSYSFFLSTGVTDCHYDDSIGDYHSRGPVTYQPDNGDIFMVFDYYFDKPITVYDSFYVGASNRFSSELLSEGRGSSANYVYFNQYLARIDTSCFTTALWKVYPYTTYYFPPFRWSWYPTSQFQMVLPIIRVIDTSFANAPACPTVSGLRARGNFTDTVTVEWQYDSLHNEYELSIGREEVGPDSGTIVRLRDTTMWQFTDVAYRDVPMAAYVRTICREYDTVRYSEWSNWLRFRLHHESDDTTGVGIVVPEDDSDLSRFVRLMPNPASSRVLVMSSFGMKKVEVYDARGGKVYDQPAGGTSTDFDVSSWAKGAYVVLVHTPQGTATKRLVVQ